jgi:hypothetical protein
LNQLLQTKNAVPLKRFLEKDREKELSTSIGATNSTNRQTGSLNSTKQILANYSSSNASTDLDQSSSTDQPRHRKNSSSAFNIIAKTLSPVVETTRTDAAPSSTRLNQSQTDTSFESSSVDRQVASPISVSASVCTLSFANANASVALADALISPLQANTAPSAAFLEGNSTAKQVLQNFQHSQKLAYHYGVLQIDIDNDLILLFAF